MTYTAGYTESAAQSRAQSASSLPPSASASAMRAGPISIGPLSITGGPSVLNSDGSSNVSELEDYLSAAGLGRFHELLSKERVTNVDEISEFMGLEELKALDLKTIETKKLLRLRFVPSATTETPVAEILPAPLPTSASVQEAKEFYVTGLPELLPDADDEPCYSFQRSRLENLALGTARCMVGGAFQTGRLCCREFLDALEKKIIPAKRTETEIRRTLCSIRM